LREAFPRIISELDGIGTRNRGLSKSLRRRCETMGAAVVIVKQMTQMTSGKAYFTTPGDLTQLAPS